MDKTPLLVAQQDGVMTISLNRPDQCNALDGSLVHALRDAFYQATQDNKIRILVLKGQGAHFCAGADLTWLSQLSQSGFELSRDDARDLASLLYTMYLFPKPIVCLVQGSVMGGGLGLIACSDLVLAADNANFCFSEVKIGLTPAVISPYIVSIIGEQAARYYFLSAEKFDAERALGLRLINKIVPTADLEQAGQNLIQQLLQNSPQGLTETKRLLLMLNQYDISLELTEKTAEIFAHLRVSDQVREGLKAFIEKRAPVWETKA